MAYGQVKLGTSGDVEGEYEDPDRLAIDLDNVVEGAMNQQDAQLSVNPLVVAKPETPVTLCYSR